MTQNNVALRFIEKFGFAILYAWKGANRLFVRPQRTPEKTSSFASGFLNPYSFTLLMILIAGQIGGLWLFWQALFSEGRWLLTDRLTMGAIGAIAFLLTVPLYLGFKHPKDASPRKVWLITFFGQMTRWKVEHITLLLDWIPEDWPLIGGLKPVGYVEVNLGLHDFDIVIPEDKPIQCQNGNIYGIVSVTYCADEFDDPVDTHGRRPEGWKSGGQKLIDFNNALGTDDIKKVDQQIDDLCPAWVQYFAKGQRIDHMIDNALEIGTTLILPCVEGRIGIDEIKHNLPASIQNRFVEQKLDEISKIKTAGRLFSNSKADDARNLGIRFEKFQCRFFAIKAIRDARDRIAIEEAQAQSQRRNQQTVRENVAEWSRIHREGLKDERGKTLIYPDPADKQPTVNEIKENIRLDNLADQGKLQGYIGRGANVVALDEQKKEKEST